MLMTSIYHPERFKDLETIKCVFLRPCAVTNIHFLYIVITCCLLYRTSCHFSFWIGCFYFYGPKLITSSCKPPQPFASLFLYSQLPHGGWWYCVSEETHFVVFSSGSKSSPALMLGWVVCLMTFINLHALSSIKLCLDDIWGRLSALS